MSDPVFQLRATQAREQRCTERSTKPIDPVWVLLRDIPTLELRVRRLRQLWGCFLRSSLVPDFSSFCLSFFSHVYLLLHSGIRRPSKRGDWLRVQEVPSRQQRGRHQDNDKYLAGSLATALNISQTTSSQS
jgi:hypothetical protein